MKRLLSLFLLLFFSVCAFGQAECEIWKNFINAQKKGAEAILPDFSFAGYHHGEVGAPDSEAKMFNVCDYGAKPDDGISDREAFEKAISAARKNGSGIVYFPKGRYDLRPKDAPNVPILIKGSNIVLKGEGSGVGGTELFMEYPNPAADPKKLYSSPCLISFEGKGTGEAITDVVSDAPKGSFQVKVASADGIKAGDWVCLYLKNNDPELIAQELSPYKVEDDWKQILNDGVMVRDCHQVVGVKGKVLTFKEPLMHAVESRWGWTIREYVHLEEVGVEDLAFVGNWKEKFVHHKDWLNDGGYKPLVLKNVVNSWMRRCRFTDISEALSVITSANVSVFSCKITGNVGHSAMRAQGSSRVFFGLIDDQPAQWHSVGFSKPSIGTVLWRIKTASNSCFESHATQPRASLLDVCEGGFMRGRAGGAIGSNPNHLADLVLWNYHETDEPTVDFDFWAADTPYWRFLPPIIVGFHGAGTTFLQSQVACDESNGTPVQPESLYEAQLQLRLGFLPQWIQNLKNGRDVIEVKDTESLGKAVSELDGSCTILLEDGDYEDIKLIVRQSGRDGNPIIVRALHPGKVTFSGDVKVELKGDYIQLDGLVFKDGNRNPSEWKSHGPGLVCVYGNHCGVFNCLFDDFDDANSAYITTSLDADGRVPQHCHIDHCAFIGKRTLDQVINLNNTLSKTVDGEPGPPMYHRISYCYFSNPKKKGNAGGGIRIGYWRKDYGRCLIDHNLFERQDSEPEIITCKSMENIILSNTFLNCRGTMNFRHGDKQVALNNIFVSTDELHGYGGMFVWGSNHIIANNYFSLSKTLADRGGAALCFNCGPKASEHALAYDILVAGNSFVDNKGFDFDLAALYERRVDAYGSDKVELPYDIRFIKNLVTSKFRKEKIWNEKDLNSSRQVWIGNQYEGLFGIVLNNDSGWKKVHNPRKSVLDKFQWLEILPYNEIEGWDIDFAEEMSSSQPEKLERCDVGPLWSINLQSYK